MSLFGKLVWHTTLGLRGSDTSTAVKFFGALSCANQMMRRPSGAICTDMPSPMPPKPSSKWWERSLKFQVTTPEPFSRGARRVAGAFFAAGFLVAGFLAAAFLAVAFLGAAFGAPLRLAVDFFAAFFFATFMPFSIAHCGFPARTFSAFRRVKRGTKCLSRTQCTA